MTREEEIRQEQIKQASIEWKKANNPVCVGGDAFSDMIDLINVSQEFIAGAEFADNHPKSPWVSVDEDLPKFVFTNNFEHRSAECLVWVKDEKCGGGRLERGYLMVKKQEDRMRWSYTHEQEYYPEKVTHWMPIPQVPKNDN